VGSVVIAAFRIRIFVALLLAAFFGEMPHTAARSPGCSGRSFLKLGPADHASEASRQRADHAAELIASRPSITTRFRSAAMRFQFVDRLAAPLPSDRPTVGNVAVDVEISVQVRRGRIVRAAKRGGELVLCGVCRPLVSIPASQDAVYHANVKVPAGPFRTKIACRERHFSARRVSPS
jgi:hypothetical protein